MKNLSITIGKIYPRLLAVCILLTAFSFTVESLASEFSSWRFAGIPADKTIELKWVEQTGRWIAMGNANDYSILGPNHTNENATHLKVEVTDYEKWGIFIVNAYRDKVEEEIDEAMIECHLSKRPLIDLRKIKRSSATIKGELTNLKNAEINHMERFKGSYIEIIRMNLNKLFDLGEITELRRNRFIFLLEKEDIDSILNEFSYLFDYLDEAIRPRYKCCNCLNGIFHEVRNIPEHLVKLASAKNMERKVEEVEEMFGDYLDGLHCLTPHTRIMFENIQYHYETVLEDIGADEESIKAVLAKNAQTFHDHLSNVSSSDNL